MFSFADPEDPRRWGLHPLWIQSHSGIACTANGGSQFDFGAKTTASNAMRVLRALQLKKAILLEGSPGVGKTSLVAGLAAATGKSWLYKHVIDDALLK